MKKITLLAFALTINYLQLTNTCKAQGYQKMLADSNEFDVMVNLGVVRLSNPQQTLSSCFQINANIWYAKKDSLYKGKAYKKVTNYNSFQGLIREDTLLKKVFFIPYCDTTEDLLYNFSLNQGDTISYNFPNLFTFGSLMTSGIFTVDSIRLKHDYRSYYHKHFYLRNHAAHDSTLEMIEGVGNVSHPLFLYYNFMQTGPILALNCSAFNFSEILTCKWNNGIRVYYDSCAYHAAVIQGCYNITDTCNYMDHCGGIVQNKALEQIGIYPNPSNGTFIIETNATTKQTIQIYDVNGKVVLMQTINAKATIDA
ncbi:MAG TPA: T9SS type A sorting domain-containing protein, partial [Bacteroidia bacterium]